MTSSICPEIVPDSAHAGLHPLLTIALRSRSTRVATAVSQPLSVLPNQATLTARPEGTDDHGGRRGGSGIREDEESRTDRPIDHGVEEGHRNSLTPSLFFQGQRTFNWGASSSPLPTFERAPVYRRHWGYGSARRVVVSTRPRPRRHCGSDWAPLHGADLCGPGILPRQSGGD